MSALTTGQKIHVCELARKAYEAWPGRDEYERRMGSTGKNGLTTWRHDQQENVVGVRSLRHCTDVDFKALAAHFHRVRMVYLQDAAVAEMSFSP